MPTRRVPRNWYLIVRPRNVHVVTTGGEPAIVVPTKGLTPEGRITYPLAIWWTRSRPGDRLWLGRPGTRNVRMVAARGAAKVPAEAAT